MTTTSPEEQLSDEPSRPRAIEAAPWTSAITDYDEENVWVHGVPIDEAIDTMGFCGMMLLLWTGTHPEPPAERLLEACLTASVDHGAVTPSATAARTASSVRQTPTASLAAGLLTVTDYHGGAVTPCMEVLEEEIEGITDPVEWARQVAGVHRAARRRIPGIGHRVHTNDRRALRLLALAGETIPDAPYVARIRALSEALSQHAGRPLTVNIDGAVAACLSSIGLAPIYGTLAFAIGRSAGLSAHIVEERMRQRPMRTISPEKITYDGPRPGVTPRPPEE